MTAAPRPFDDIRALIGQMPKADEAARAASARLSSPSPPARLEEIAEWMRVCTARRGHVTGGAARDGRTGRFRGLGLLEKSGGRGHNV